MKRQIYPSTDAAVAWWEANPNAIKADCFTIELPNGVILYVTEGQWDVTIPAGLSPTGGSLTFRSSQWGMWSRGKITSEASFRCQSNTMALTLQNKPGLMYPGLSLTMLNAAFNHLFDGAQVWVYTAYMPMGQYGNVQVVETKFQGRVLKAAPGRVVCKFDVGDPFFILNQKVPSRLMQSNCYKSFADANCGLNPANYTIEFTAGAATTTTITPSVAFTQPDGYFTQGVIKCLTGANAGLVMTVKSHKSGVLTVMVPWLLPVSPGDTFSVIKGCDLTPTTCAGMTHTDGTAEPDNWQTRFGGTPYVPPPTSIY